MRDFIVSYIAQNMHIENLQSKLSCFNTIL